MGDNRRITVTSKRQITLPVEVCRDLGIGKGDQLEIVQVDDEIRLKPVPRFAPLTKNSSLFRFVGVSEGPGGPGARHHDRVLADEADRRQIED